ncbi:MAG: hypothetical protein FWH27_09545 [Planctomycetaceae bacterium]|nr:hypothetical protein [Planctomycetaceae bacterium]
MAHYLAVDWDTTELRLVLAASQRGSIRILKAESEPLEFEDDPDGKTNVNIGLTLKNLIKRHKAPHAPLLLGLNRASVDMMTFRLPRSKPEELPDLVKNQALRDSPGFTETSPLDFIVSPASEGDYLRTIAATISKAQLKQYRGMCQAAGLRAKRIEFRPLALAELYWNSTPADSRPVLLVQCTQSEIDMVVVEETNVAFVRSIKLPESLSDEERTSRIVSEIARTIAVSRQEVEGAALEKVIVYGDADEFQPLLERLTDQEINAVVQNPFQLPCVFAPARAKITGASDNPGHYASLFGMILSEQSKAPVRIDFLHPREKPQPLNIARFVVLFLLLVGIVGFAAYFWNKQQLAQLEERLAGLNTAIEQLTGEYWQQNPKYAQLSQASTWDYQQMVWLDELRDISVRLPDEQDLVIDQISFALARPYCVIDLVARVRDTGVIRQIISNFQSDNHHTVTVANQRPVRGGGGYPVICSIRIAVAKRDYSYYQYFLLPELQKISSTMPDALRNEPAQPTPAVPQAQEPPVEPPPQKKPALPHVFPPEYVPNDVPDEVPEDTPEADTTGDKAQEETLPEGAAPDMEPTPEEGGDA